MNTTPTINCPTITQAATTVNPNHTIAHIKNSINDMLGPFLGKTNDEYTRMMVYITYVNYLHYLQTANAVSDFVVTCDHSNNSPKTIMKNELHVDLAIKPSKSTDFIYVPIVVINGTIGDTKLDPQFDASFKRAMKGV